MHYMIAAVLVAASVSACALIEDKVPIDYVPANEAAPVPGASGVVVSLAAIDARQTRTDRVSTKKNLYGMEMAKIVATNDLALLVRSAVERTFRAEGFGVAAGGLAVTIELQTFYSNYHATVLIGSAEAEVAFALKVRNASGALLYQNFYSASGTVDRFQHLSPGDNAKEALEKALAAAVKQVADDKALQAALLSTLPGRGS